MEQRTKDDTSAEQIEDSSNSPTQKRAKGQPDNLQQVETTSFNADPSDDHLIGLDHFVDQPSNNSDDSVNQQPSRNRIFNFILTSEEDCFLAPGENLEPNSAGLKSSRTRGVWHKSLEESHSAQIKGKSLLGN